MGIESLKDSSIPRKAALVFTFANGKRWLLYLEVEKTAEWFKVIKIYQKVRVVKLSIYACHVEFGMLNGIPPFEIGGIINL